MCNLLRLKIVFPPLFFMWGERTVLQVSKELKSLGQEPRHRLSFSCVICSLLQCSLLLAVLCLCQIKVGVIKI